MGSSGTEQKLKIDTSSGLSWIQCEPCTTCFEQSEDLSIFDPSTSDSYTAVACDNRICDTDYEGGDVTYTCNESDDGSSTSCGYSFTYVDGSNTSGTISTDTIAVDSIDSDGNIKSSQGDGLQFFTTYTSVDMFLQAWKLLEKACLQACMATCYDR